MAHYVGIFVPVESGGWQAIIPDVPGCRVEGPSLDKTVFIAAAALTRIVRVDIDPAPPPRDLSEIKADPKIEVDWEKAVVTMIPLWV